MAELKPSGAAEIVSRQFEALGRDGVDAASEFWHPDIDWRAVEGAADDVGVMKGADRVRRYYQDWAEMFEEIGAEVDAVISDSEERCAVSVRNFGRPRGSSAAVSGRYYVACTVRDGLITSGREYETRREVEDACGDG